LPSTLGSWLGWLLIAVPWDVTLGTQSLGGVTAGNRLASDSRAPDQAPQTWPGVAGSVSCSGGKHRCSPCALPGLLLECVQAWFLVFRVGVLVRGFNIVLLQWRVVFKLSVAVQPPPSRFYLGGWSFIWQGEGLLPVSLACFVLPFPFLGWEVFCARVAIHRL
jgi:hypothetical protein